jgi:hypothetical protein
VFVDFNRLSWSYCWVSYNSPKKLSYIIYIFCLDETILQKSHSSFNSTKEPGMIGLLLAQLQKKTVYSCIIAVWNLIKTHTKICNVLKMFLKRTFGAN